MNLPLARALMWFRRDLRADDNAALYHALCAAEQVWCVFVFDRDILDPLPRADRRVEFIRESLVDLDAQLRALGTANGHSRVRLLVRHGCARQEIVGLARQLGVEAVYANHDDEPDALARDAATGHALGQAGIAFHTHKDHVIFERGEVLTQGGTPYTVFTPYKRAWLAKLEPFYLRAYPVARHAKGLADVPSNAELRVDADASVPTLEAIGFEPTNLRALNIPTGSGGARALLDDFLPRIAAYGQARDFPAVNGPSYLSVHLRFGTVSIRELARLAEGLGREPSATRQDGDGDADGPGRVDGAAVWLSELIWRDFYHQVLHHFPHVARASFKPAYDRIAWADGAVGDVLFAAWCEGRTGYPLIDAAMAQINTTGYMHNRLRMVVASFLTKDLGVDWRRGERYFALALNDYDLASNNGGWQWAASSGSDAQPYFRIFNPVSQSEKFDARGGFIRRFLPQLAALPDKYLHEPWAAPEAVLVGANVTLGGNYPRPIVDHGEARALTLQRFAVVKRAEEGASSL